MGSVRGGWPPLQEPVRQDFGPTRRRLDGSIPLASSSLSSTYISSHLARIVWCYYSVRTVGVQPVRSGNQIAFCNAIVPFPHERRLVSNDLHSRRCINACPSRLSLKANWERSIKSRKNTPTSPLSQVTYFDSIFIKSCDGRCPSFAHGKSPTLAPLFASLLQYTSPASPPRKA